MKNFRTASAQGHGVVVTFGDKVKSYKNEGRKDSWTREKIEEARQEATRRLNECQAVRRKALIEKQMEIEDMVTRPQNYAERAYHLQKADALTRGLEGPELVKAYQNILRDPEARQHKAEYETLISQRIDLENRQGFERIRQENLTHEEVNLERERRFLDTMKKHEEMIAGFEKKAIDEILNEGQTGINIEEITRLAFDNAEENRLRDLKPEDKPKNQEAIRKQQEFDKEAASS